MPKRQEFFGSFFQKKEQQGKGFFLKTEAKSFVCFGFARWGPSALHEPNSTPAGITSNALSARAAIILFAA
jgi:hypothetical protein